jgi:hypothetical protein
VLHAGAPTTRSIEEALHSQRLQEVYSKDTVKKGGIMLRAPYRTCREPLVLPERQSVLRQAAEEEGDGG